MDFFLGKAVFKRDSMEKTKSEVVPGAFLTTEEEYTPGQNTVEDASGNVYSTCVGNAEFDDANREVKVTCDKSSKPLDVGTEVYAVVSDARDNMVLVNITSAQKDGKKRAFAMSTASIPVREIDEKYVEKAKDLFKAGDIVKARVIKALPYGTDLSTKSSELGVVKAYCVKCKSPLHRFGHDLKCTNCGTTEERKLSKDYVAE